MPTATIAIPRADWAAYFERLMSECPVEHVSIEVESADRGHELQASGLLLEALIYDPRGDVFEIAASRPTPNGHEGLRHMISHPETIQVDGPTGILPTAIAVDDADGVRTLIRLNPTAAISG